MLHRLSKENIKASPGLRRKKSKENILKYSVEKLRQSHDKIKLSRDNLRRSKTCLNASFVKTASEVSRKDMQNYLISQVLFDGKETVASSRNNLDQSRKDEENKRKEIEMINREREVKKQIEVELRKIKASEEEQKIKQQEASFESYKLE